MSRTVVVPLISMRRMALVARKSSLSGFSVIASTCASEVAEQCMWQWASQRPGRRRNVSKIQDRIFGTDIRRKFRCRRHRRDAAIIDENGVVGAATRIHLR